MNIFKNTLSKITIITLLMIFSFSIVNVAFGASIVDKLGDSIQGIDLINAGNSNADTVAQGIIGKIIGAFLSFLGVIFMILLVYGGFRWMNARGNEDEAKKAKDVIFQAIIGLVIIMSAYALSYFISTIVSGF